MEHWCIKIGCGHGTLNGSLELGNLYLQEYQKGYDQGFYDISFDVEELRTFASHFDYCAYSLNLSDPCNCGFDHILEKYEKWINSVSERTTRG